MKKIIYKSEAIQAVIWIVAVLLLVSLWPLRIWHETVTESVLPEKSAVTDVVNDDHTILQSFVAQYDHMGTISLYLGDETEGESFFVRLMNEEQSIIAEETVQIQPENLPGYCKVLMDVDMEVGKMYHLIIQGNSSAVFLGCGFIPMTDMPYAGIMYYDNQPVEGMNLIADYHYSVPLRKGKVALFGGLAFVLAVLLTRIVRRYFSGRERDGLITVEKAFKGVMNPLAAVFAVVCLGAVLLGACGHYLLDNSVFFISALLLSGILFYGINHNRDGQIPVITLAYIKSHFSDLFQSLCIAGAIGACCEYMSGLYDIHHAVAERREMLWFALAVIAMFKWKEICNLHNLIYLIGAGAYGYYYYVSNLTEEMDELNVTVLKYTVWIAILLGFIVIRTVITLFKRKQAKFSVWYGSLLLLFFAAIIIFRNGRWWTVALVVSFGLFYLAYGAWEHKERLLTNLSRGIILQFIWATGFALLHRPYLTFRTARYTHIFHTVTITASYLTMVECAAMVILLSKLSKSRSLRDYFKEALLFGVVSSYMLFTMARTGFLAVGVTLLFAVVVMASGRGRKKLLSIAGSLGIMILAVLICLPVTFTVQRTVPALVSDPYVYEIESYVDEALRGRKLNSVEFMRVGRFIDVFAEKVFGLPEGTFDVYGEIAEYKRTHGSSADAKITETQKEEKMKLETEDDVQAVASLHYMPDITGEASVEEGASGDNGKENDYTNGRLDIFRSYIKQLNMNGHEEMGAILENGEIATHAHNIYLQVAYDHGIPSGILFVLVVIASFVRSCLYYHEKRDKITYALLPAVVTTSVAVAGLAEWIFHLSNPCGFVWMLVITPLLFRDGDKG